MQYILKSQGYLLSTAAPGISGLDYMVSNCHQPITWHRAGISPTLHQSTFFGLYTLMPSRSRIAASWSSSASAFCEMYPGKGWLGRNSSTHSLGIVCSIIAWENLNAPRGPQSQIAVVTTHRLPTPKPYC